jgi:hypothetical protein
VQGLRVVSRHPAGGEALAARFLNLAARNDLKHDHQQGETK